MRSFASAEFRRSARSFASLAVLGAFIAACSNTGVVTLGVCGNHVLEKGEDCDGASGSSLHCSADCHFQCSAQVACPVGFGCDNSARICRAASGSFTRTTLLATGDYTFPTVADFDDDGRDDLLLTSSNQFGAAAASSVYFFDAGAGASAPLTLPDAVAASAFDFDGDGRADVVLGGDALYAYRSLAPRRFSPLLGNSWVVSDNSRLFSADIDCDQHKDLLLWQDGSLFRVDTAGSKQKLIDIGFSYKPAESAPGSNSDSASSSASASSDSAGSDSAGSDSVGSSGAASSQAPTSPSSRKNYSAVGELGPGAAVPRSCDLLALYDPVASHVHVYGVRPDDMLGTVRLLSDIELTDAPTVESFMFLDVNGDGRDDLVAQVTVGSTADPASGTNGQYVSFGVGDGTFDSHDNPPTSVGDERAGRHDVPETNGVLAVGHFNDLPGLDYFGESLQVGASTVLYESAIASDFTGDGRTDVAAVISGAIQGFDLLRGTPSGLFSRLPISTNQAPTLFDTGDFDGDGQSDLLISEGLTPDSKQTTLSVVFSPVTPSSARVQELSELDSIEDTAAGYVTDTSGYTDGYGDIAALNRGSAGKLELGVLEGGPDRLLRSDWSTPRDPSKQSALTYIPVVGNFLGTSRTLAVIGSPIICANSSSSDSKCGAATIEVFSVEASGVTSLGSAALDGTVNYTSVVALDLDEDGADEIYVRDHDGLLQIALGGGDAKPLRVTSRKVDVPGFSQDQGLEIKAADVNTDGHEDLSVLSGTTVWVFLAGDALTQPHALVVAADVCASPLTHAWLQADADATRELALLCLAQAASPQSGPSPAFSTVLTLLDADLHTNQLERLASQAGPASAFLAVGDFNGDGVDDLVATGGEVSLVLGIPK